MSDATHLISTAPGQPTRTLDLGQRDGKPWSYTSRAGNTDHADADTAAAVDRAARALGVPARAIVVKPITRSPRRGQVREVVGAASSPDHAESEPAPRGRARARGEG